MLQPIIDVLASILTFLHNNVVSDYGVAIILLTVLVRIVILPLTVRQTQQMYEMQRLQPKLRELQDKYKDNKEKLQQEMMKFYSEHKVNPLGGCLPLILQLPIFYALFRMLSVNKAILASTSLGFFQLGLAPSKSYAMGFMPFIPYLILILLLAATTYIPQRMMTTDPQQQKMGLYMMPIMVIFGWSLPAGVLVYWVTTNIWTIGQQYVMVRLASTKAEVKNGENN